MLIYWGVTVLEVMQPMCAPLRRGAELQHTHISPSLVSSANTISSSLPSNGDAKENETPD